MADDTIYGEKYDNSWAVVVGIDAYDKAPPLGYACSDATAIAETLRGRFGFPAANVALLLDRDATRDNISRTFLDLATVKVRADDRAVFFFAGHGYTHTGKRGEVGFLVPVDGAPGELASLIRWDELTRNADLIRAKHLLFIMDACYGGLAVTRALSPGSTRFVNDMLQRYARQVLTAGKADETVADSGGPRRGHSMFTGHLLDGLEGKASKNGVLTANGLMAYVYDRVAKDVQSRQTPHYGFVAGDGDLIFQTPQPAPNASANVEAPVAIQIPPEWSSPQPEPGPAGVVDQAKELLADPRFRIRLDDLVTREIRRVLSAVSIDHFSPRTPASKEEFAERLRRYERATEDLRGLTVLLVTWGGNDHRPIIEKVIARLGEANIGLEGQVLWLRLATYPLLLLTYSAGIAAVASGNYSNLATVLFTPVPAGTVRERQEPSLVHVVEEFLEIERMSAFKGLPGFEKRYVPRSDYLFGMLQPPLEDLLFLGSSYENLFDRCEMILALVFADFLKEKRGRVWGPPGRFAWKQYHTEPSPLSTLIAEAERDGREWPPLVAGLFGGSVERFSSLARDYMGFIAKLGWF